MWKKLDQFHLKCLRKVCGISEKDRIPNTTVLELCEIESIEALLIKGQLRRAEHLTRMEENRMPKALFCGELVGGQRPRLEEVGTKGKKMFWNTTWRYVIYPFKTRERQALNRPQWRTACLLGVERFERCRIAQLHESCIARPAAQSQPVPNTDFVCPDCQCYCRLLIGLISHPRKHSTLLNWCLLHHVPEKLSVTWVWTARGKNA